ncbi:MAG: helix-turn-helix domain-containing protein [Dokdonella sp.]|uniref:YdaS family helix-turn-helix protein n=1 Tax=Dokdonella sp. TaxID=2291710 RepID=UPI0025C045B2|nr:YdaS family helix-turn-helix protein [Dokdonella sp.]MBK8123967.1 helix-turn-helix domain-containing protein [Dokdonella sp.]
MNLEQFFDNYGTARVEDVARAAGTNLAYLRQCKYGARRMSADLAVKMEDASAGVMTASELRPDLPWRK